MRQALDRVQQSRRRHQSHFYIACCSVEQSTTSRGLHAKKTRTTLQGTLAFRRRCVPCIRYMRMYKTSRSLLTSRQKEKTLLKEATPRQAGNTPSGGRRMGACSDSRKGAQNNGAPSAKLRRDTLPPPASSTATHSHILPRFTQGKLTTFHKTSISISRV